jgi:predicted nucleic acid-binding protein
LDDNRAALIGLVVAEVLQGCRNQAEADWTASELQGVPFIDPTWKEWRLTAELCRNLAKLGKSIPITDLVLVAVAQNRSLSVCTIDPHFDLFENLQRVDLRKPYNS